MRGNAPMPNLSFFIPTQAMPSDGALAELTAQCTALCVDLLQAALANVHIVYVGVHLGRGHPVFAQLQYRLAPNRTPALMDSFMQRLDQAIRQHAGLSARIRCFGYAADAIHARH